MILKKIKFIIFIISLIKIIKAYNSNLPIRYLKYNNVKNELLNIYKVKKSNNYTLEHIVPQCLYKKEKNIKCDMHNLIFYPIKLNVHRSNYKYSIDRNVYQNSKILDFSGDVLNTSSYINERYSIKTSNMKIFHPSEIYRGEISRSCMYFFLNYRNFREIIFKNVIDYNALIEWHEKYPVTDFELIKNEKIYQLQGNENIFVSNPEILVPVIEAIIKKKNYRFLKY